MRAEYPGEGGGKGVPAGEARGVHALVHRAGEAQVDFEYALAKVSKKT